VLKENTNLHHELHVHALALVILSIWNLMV
jgi:hypothetical protein